jgi:hypothetical protein
MVSVAVHLPQFTSQHRPTFTANGSARKHWRDNAALKPAQLAQVPGISESEVSSTIKPYEQEQVILGYQTT